MKLINIGAIMLLLCATSCTKKQQDAAPTHSGTSLESASASSKRMSNDVPTTTMTHRTISPLVTATGVVSIDPRSVGTISARFDGRIERIYLYYEFQPVQRGDRIMDIYSPSILAEEQHLISVVNTEGEHSELLKVSMQALANLGVTQDQINKIVSTRQPINPLPIYSLYTGHIHQLSSSMKEPRSIANQSSSGLSLKVGAYVKTGEPLMEVYDGSRAWVLLNITQSDATLVERGDHVTIRSQSDRTNPMSATIDYVEPSLDPATSTLRARIYLTGVLHESAFKIGSLVDATISTKQYDGAWLPRSAVIRLGKHDVVFAKQNAEFVATSVVLGVQTDSLVQIRSGISDTTTVALDANYSIDADSFISFGGKQ